MNYKKNIFLNGFKVSWFEEALLLQNSEIVELVDQPSHNKNEPLNFAYNLIS